MFVFPIPPTNRRVRRMMKRLTKIRLLLLHIFVSAYIQFSLQISHPQLKIFCVLSKFILQLVGSTPNFPYGTMDNIEEIAELGMKYGIPVHVDCCLGSFVIALMTELGYTVPPFDFSVPGVTSMSVDTHKVRRLGTYLHIII